MSENKNLEAALKNAENADLGTPEAKGGPAKTTIPVNHQYDIVKQGGKYSVIDKTSKDKEPLSGRKLKNALGTIEQLASRNVNNPSDLSALRDYKEQNQSVSDEFKNAVYEAKHPEENKDPSKEKQDEKAHTKFDTAAAYALHNRIVQEQKEAKEDEAINSARNSRDAQRTGLICGLFDKVTDGQGSQNPDFKQQLNLGAMNNQGSVKF